MLRLTRLGLHVKRQLKRIHSFFFSTYAGQNCLARQRQQNFEDEWLASHENGSRASVGHGMGRSWCKIGGCFPASNRNDKTGGDSNDFEVKNLRVHRAAATRKS